MRLDCVMSHTWSPTATEVICWPTLAMPSADHRRRYGALTRRGVRSAKSRGTAANLRPRRDAEAHRSSRGASSLSADDLPPLV